MLRPPLCGPARRGTISNRDLQGHPGDRGVPAALSRLISHRVPFGDAGRAFSSRSLPARLHFARGTPAATGSPPPAEEGRARMTGNPEDSDADDATRISRASLASLRRAASITPGASPARYPTRRGSDAGPAGNQGGGCMAGLAGAGGQRAGGPGSSAAANLISEPHRVSVRTPRLRTLTQYP